MNQPCIRKPRGPAGRVLLDRGDVVESGRPCTPVIDDAADFERALLGVRPGETVTLTVLRGADRVPVQMNMPRPGTSAVARLDGERRTAAARPAALRRVSPADPEVTAEEAVGLFERRSACTVERVVAGAGGRLAEFGYKGGYRVTAVRPGGPAARALVKPGDVLLGLHDFSTLIPADFAYVLNLAADDGVKMLRCDILRGTERLYTFLKLDAR